MSQVRGLQININANRYRIDRAQKLFHAGHLYVDRSAKVDKSKMTNEIGSIWEGNGPNPPQQLLFNAVTAEMYQQVERDGQLIFENLGISINAALAETEAGLDQSGAAKREEVKKSDARNSVKQQAWENFHIDLIKVALGIVREIVGDQDNAAADGKKAKKSGYVVSTPGKKGLTKVDWKDVKADEDEYVLEAMPASPIPTTPEGLVAFGDRMIELGAWKPQQLAGYMQDLDADGQVNRDMAKQRNLEKIFEGLLYDKASAAMPDEFTDFAMAMDIGLNYLAQGEDDGVDEKKLERVRRYLRRVKALTKAAQGAAQGQPSQPAPAGQVAVAAGPAGAAAPPPAVA
jgi:hypothetical protein